ncbi:MAG: shikimate kinase [Clostridia bacterium]|nr:shikimate kinase [Clostridia bacterium]
MPACGKSTVGVLLSRAAGMKMVDVDRLIERQEGLSLSKIIERDGDAAFRALEEEMNASLKLEDTVIAPGGSVIYGPKAMEHLRKISLVVYLRLTLETMERRLHNLHARGVTFKPGQTIADLYAERTPLYQRYSHIVIDCDSLRPREIVAAVRKETGV